jgi:hypothetical protein
VFADESLPMCADSSIRPLARAMNPPSRCRAAHVLLNIVLLFVRQNADEPLSIVLWN